MLSRRALLRRATTALVLSAAGAAAIERSALAQPDEPRPVLFGAWQRGLPWDFDALTKFERAAGLSAGIVHWYQAWEEGQAHEVNTRWLKRAADRGAVPMVSWGPFNWADDADQPEYALRRIAIGRFDDHVRAWADGLAAYEKPLLLRWAWEMNLRWAPWGRGVNGNHTEQYVDAWRRLRRIFAEAGATNVQWVWSPNVLLPTDLEQSAFEPFFPGDDHVDWLALDAYNHEPWYGWRSFAEVVDESYQRLTALSQKPVMLAELGCSERRGHPGAKAAWIADALGTAVFERPRIRAVVWFNEQKREPTGTIDWRVDSSAESARAFRAAVSGSPYLGRWREPTE